eukprot:675209-Rhodomonas_salina.1
MACAVCHRMACAGRCELLTHMPCAMRVPDIGIRGASSRRGSSSSRVWTTEPLSTDTKRWGSAAQVRCQTT